jgi:hypothetical protein
MAAAPGGAGKGLEEALVVDALVMRLCYLRAWVVVCEEDAAQLAVVRAGRQLGWGWGLMTCTPCVRACVACGRADAVVCRVAARQHTHPPACTFLARWDRVVRVCVSLCARGWDGGRARVIVSCR